MCDFSELFVGVCSRMWLSHLPVYFDSGSSLICLWLSSQDFFHLICFWVGVSGSVICNLFVGAVPDVRSDLSLYVPERKVCEWFVGLFCRILCL